MKLERVINSSWSRLFSLEGAKAPSLSGLNGTAEAVTHPKPLMKPVLCLVT
jgi:hypothetical protein